MSKTKTKSPSKLAKVQPLEILALIAALFYTQSFNTNLGNYAQGLDGAQHPDVYTLVFALLVTGYYLYKRSKLSLIGAVTLTVLAVVSLIWFFGFRLNFS